ncbi:hypothetical protein [Actinomadura rubteroloni]|nr:hypothetical protein [Actinomadura rubteroloni]
MAIFGVRKQPAVSAIITALSLAGGPLLLAELVRHYGRKTQESLWASWGGSPTTQKLRLREQSQNSLQRETWRKAISALTDTSLASARSERANPARADEAIEVAVGKVRNLTRDGDKFPLVRAENRSYGFHRNLYGVRWIARIIALLSLVGCIIYIGSYGAFAKHPIFTTVNVTAVVLALACLGCWFIFPSSRRVRDAADRYAYELLQAAVILCSEKEASQTADDS